MIVLDASALMALLLGEPQADEIAGIFQTEEHVMISARTLAEALVVAGPRGVSDEMMQLARRDWC